MVSLQGVFLVLLAPAAAGWVSVLKARLQGRRGPSPWRPYWQLLKLFDKTAMVPEGASWLFTSAPYIVFAATVAASLLVPVFWPPATPAMGDAVVLVGLLALARFFTALAAMDPGSAFGGMGASREMTLSALGEPALLMSIFVLSTAADSTALGPMADAALEAHLGLRPSLAFALAALVLVAIAECGRIPVDNPTTHLELTMVHEAMILEYSGRHLALMEWAAHIRLLLFATLIVNLFFPLGLAVGGGGWLAPLAWVVKIAVVLASLALLETWMAKMRIFRVPEYLAVAFLLGLLGMLSHYILEVGA